MSIIATTEQLEAIYGEVGDASTVKVADRVTPLYRVLIEKSPFAALATSGPEGLDCSPRGDLPGFVRIHDDKTLMMPDRRGNNRIDSLRNIVCDPRIALLFLIPGSGSTLRVNGRAEVSAAPDLLASFKMDGKAPRTVIVIDRGRDLFSVRSRDRAIRSVESRQARRPPEPADPGTNPGLDERRQGWRRKLRPGMAGARAENHVVKRHLSEFPPRRAFFESAVRDQ
jgi:uncharacterized protein